MVHPSIDIHQKSLSVTGTWAVIALCLLSRFLQLSSSNYTVDCIVKITLHFWVLKVSCEFCYCVCIMECVIPNVCMQCVANWPCDNYYDSVYCVSIRKIFVVTNSMKLSSNTNMDNIP